MEGADGGVSVERGAWRVERGEQRGFGVQGDGSARHDVEGERGEREGVESERGGGENKR